MYNAATKEETVIKRHSKGQLEAAIATLDPNVHYRLSKSMTKRRADQMYSQYLEQKSLRAQAMGAAV